MLTYADVCGKTMQALCARRVCVGGEEVVVPNTCAQACAARDALCKVLKLLALLVQKYKWR